MRNHGPEQLADRRHPVPPEDPRLVRVTVSRLFVQSCDIFNSKPFPIHTFVMPDPARVGGAMYRHSPYSPLDSPVQNITGASLPPSSLLKYTLFAPTGAPIWPNGLLKFGVPCSTFTYATVPDNPALRQCLSICRTYCQPK